MTEYYYAAKDGVVCAVRNDPHPEYPHASATPIECGIVVGTATDAELAAAQVAVAQKQAVQAAIAGIYAPVAYNGKTYPVDPESMAKYEMAKQSRNRGKMTKAIAIATDGSVLRISNAAAIDAFHGAMEDSVLARISAIHDGIR